MRTLIDTAALILVVVAIAFAVLSAFTPSLGLSNITTALLLLSINHGIWQGVKYLKRMAPVDSVDLSQRLQRASQLMRERKYEDARAQLAFINDPRAQSALDKIDEYEINHPRKL